MSEADINTSLGFYEKFKKAVDEQDKAFFCLPSLFNNISNIADYDDEKNKFSEKLIDIVFDIATKIKAKTTVEKNYNRYLKDRETAIKQHRAEQKKKAYEAYVETLPEWFDGEKIDEPVFANEFRRVHEIITVNGHCYNKDGAISDNDIEKNIYDVISQYITTDTEKKTNKLLAAIKLSSYEKKFPFAPDEIHCKNGTFDSDGNFQPCKKHCINRLNVEYSPDAPVPEKWLKFLSELMYDEDIATLQEYSGYCLTANTKGQRMLSIIGDGGEGKSRLKEVFKCIFGTAITAGHLDKLEDDRFAVADLENKLVFFDDDVNMSMLENTSKLKSIVTNENMFRIERKCVQAYEAPIYARIICLGNGLPVPLHDLSDGFWRRQLLIKVKPKPKDRVDDTELAKKLCAEIQGIFNWALDGLKRLRENGYKFTVSDRSKNILSELQSESDSISAFLESDYVKYGENEFVKKPSLYWAYEQFCDNNGFRTRTEGVFHRNISQKADKYKIDTKKQKLISPKPNEKLKMTRVYGGISHTLETHI